MDVLPLVSAIVPALLLMWFFHARDIYREPARLVWATFGLGVLSVVPVILLEVPLIPVWDAIEDPWVAGLLNAFPGASLPEELCKFAVLTLYCLRRTEFNEAMDGLVYGAAASMGFAAVENVLYVMDGGLRVAIFRSITAVPFHALNGAIMGYFLALARFVPRSRVRFVVLGLLIPIVIHGLYDWPLMISDRLPEGSPAGGFLQLLAGAVLALAAGMVASLLHRIRVLQALHPVPDIPHDDLALYHRRRPRLRPWLAVLAGGLILWLGALFGAGTALDGSPAPALLALPPALLGLVLFRKGVAGLNRID